MRELVDSGRVEQFMRALARPARTPAIVYFTGGVTAVLFGWRESTIDVDLEIVPDSDEVFRAIPRIKEELRINVELAAPSHFIPELPGWRERSPLIETIAPLTFRHYDLYAQALSKIERGHLRDRLDVEAMLERKLIDRVRLCDLYESIEPDLYRYPAINPDSFRAAVREMTR